MHPVYNTFASLCHHCHMLLPFFFKKNYIIFLQKIQVSFPFPMLSLEWLPQYSPFKFNILLLAPPLLFLPPPPLCYRPSFLSSFTSHPEARWRRRPGRWQTESCCRRMVCSCISGESSPFFLLPYNTKVFSFLQRR